MNELFDYLNESQAVRDAYSVKYGSDPKLYLFHKARFGSVQARVIFKIIANEDDLKWLRILDEKEFLT